MKAYGKWIAVGVVLSLGLIAFLFWFFPTYGVWSAQQSGKAALSNADYERQVQVVNAKANLQAQQFNADAEVIRAGGLAKANNIIKGSLSQLYIQYLWVQTLDRTHNQIIYVPTGTNGLPITEAARATAGH